MSSSVKAKPQTVTTGLYGLATTDKNGTRYNPSAFERNLINMTNRYIPEYLSQMVNPTYDSEIFKAQTAQRNRLANQSFENNLINPLASRGLTRGSSINQMSGQFANKLADLETDAMANEDTRNANILNNLFGYYQVPYNMANQTMGTSAKLYNNAYQQAALEQAGRQQQQQQLMQAAGYTASLMSDMRFKENIKPVGKLDNGLTVYLFNYKGENTPQLGLMAQEVNDLNPEAVVETENGYLAVRYDLAVL